MLYYAYEFQRQLAQPVRLWANAVEQASSSPYNPLADTWFGKSMAAGAEIVTRLTRDYGKPAFGLATTEIDGATVGVNEEILLRKPFCQLLRFRRDTAKRSPKVLLVAPMSGHYATLLRGTVEALLPDHDVHITDWTDAREVPLAQGNFDLDDYVDYIIEFCRFYPGFLQLTSFISMNLDRHVNAHVRQFEHLVKGDDDSADGHRRFYDEYLAVMDLTAEYYLQTIQVVFKEHLLPRGAWVSRGRQIDPSAIETALMTVEGELDDISGIGQTKAAHALTPGIPGARHVHWEQPLVGHYGIFNGRKWREQIMPRVRDFILANETA